MQRKKNKGIPRLIKACGYSLKGLKAAWLNEEAFRIEILIIGIIFPLGWWLGASGTQKALLIGIYFVVLIVELINSAIEAIVDRIGEEYHLLAGRAKDLGSASVFISLTACVVIWAIILFERFF
ncbi:MAG: diacylglycerol kinase [Deltaproteobacteria bacterium]|nr:diacylglycerol kinase [Deltaproteobacteria bacterium]